MKICYFCTDLTQKGGIERVLSILTTEQVKDSNVEINIVSRYKTFDTTPYYFDKRLKIIYLSQQKYSGAPGSFKRLLIHLRGWYKIYSYFKKHKFDLIISQAFPNTFMLFLALVNLKRVISVEHVCFDYYNDFIQRLRYKIYEKVLAVVTLTKEDCFCFQKKIDSVFTIPNPINLDDKYLSSLDNKKIISIGRLEHEKGFDTLIKVFSKIHTKYPDWVVEVYGEGTKKTELQKQINECGLKEHFFLRGITYDINSKLRESSFIVVTSRFEGFSMVLVEAMSQGVPGISFDCPNGPRSIITSGIDGVLVENQNEYSLYENIERLIVDIELRKKLGRTAYNNVEKFNVRTILNKWYHLYSKLGVSYK